jgi:hypothetical protein
MLIQNAANSIEHITTPAVAPTAAHASHFPLLTPGSGIDLVAGDEKVAGDGCEYRHRWTCQIVMRVREDLTASSLVSCFDRPMSASRWSLSASSSRRVLRRAKYRENTVNRTKRRSQGRFGLDTNFA